MHFPIVVAAICSCITTVHAARAPSANLGLQKQHHQLRGLYPQDCPPPQPGDGHVCGSTSPPGGLSPQNIPQFVLVTFDDAVTSYYNDFEEILGMQVNGCPARYTLFVYTQETDFTRVHKYYKQGHEIAGHTLTHDTNPYTIPDRWTDEIRGSRATIAALAHIPENEIRKFLCD